MLQLRPTRIKGSHYLLIPKDLAELLEVSDESVLNLTIEDSDKGQRLIYSILRDSSQTESLGQSVVSSRSAAGSR